MKIVYAEIDAFVKKAISKGAEEIFFQSQTAPDKEGNIAAFVMSFMFKKEEDVYLCQIVEPYAQSGKALDVIDKEYKEFEMKQITATRALTENIPLERGTIFMSEKEGT